MTYFSTLPILIATLLSSAIAASPDLERESRLAEQVVDGILDGDAEWLVSDGREFLSILTEADNATSAVIILHGRGFHPDWADAVYPLRVGLVDQDLTTLSLQMPVLEKEAKYYDYVPIFPSAIPRIEAGIQFLKGKGYDKIGLIAHSCGVHMAMVWLNQKGDQEIDFFVGLGMGATDYNQPMAEPLPLQKLGVPTLDLYGADDFPAVIRLAADRKAAMDKAGNPLSQQRVLPEADHYFTDKGDELVAEIVHWLNSL